MHVFEFIILIMIVIGIFEFLKQRQKTQAATAKSSQSQQELQDELDKVKQRLAVLESIVTDKGYDLKKEIDEL